MGESYTLIEFHEAKIAEYPLSLLPLDKLLRYPLAMTLDGPGVFKIHFGDICQAEIKFDLESINKELSDLKNRIGPDNNIIDVEKTLSPKNIIVCHNDDGLYGLVIFMYYNE